MIFLAPQLTSIRIRAFTKIRSIFYNCIPCERWFGRKEIREKVTCKIVKTEAHWLLHPGILHMSAAYKGIIPDYNKIPAHHTQRRLFQWSGENLLMSVQTFVKISFRESSWWMREAWNWQFYSIYNTIYAWLKRCSL